MNNTENKIFDRTTNALEKVFPIFSEKKYCIVGCGAIGANFAEMLARSGAKHISLIDRDKVELSNLNRVFSFYIDDDNEYKTNVVRNKLKRINPEIKGKDSIFYFGKIPNECSEEDRINLQKSRDIICDSDIIGIFCDNNKSRILLEKFCVEQNKQYLSSAIRIDPDNWNSTVFFECGWLLKTPEEHKDNEGYANNASLASVIMEATSVAFSMLLANLNTKKLKDSRFYKYRKTYKAFIPSKIEINGKIVYPIDSL